MENQALLSELHEAIERLADAVVDRPPVALTLRRLANALPEARPTSARRPLVPRDPSAIEPLLWRALVDGVIDARRFDVVMVARARAARALADRAASRHG